MLERVRKSIETAPNITHSLADNVYVAAVDQCANSATWPEGLNLCNELMCNLMCKIIGIPFTGDSTYRYSFTIVL